MSGIIKSAFQRASRILHNSTIQPTTQKLNKVWYGQNKATSEQELKDILKARFPGATEIKVEDVSGGCGAMYDIMVETVEFKGLSIVKQHRAITDSLKEQIKLIHGLQIETKVPKC
ncbi:PREDICTED: bolA-like protein 3 [Nicrophorus vespilloides]|uniref:BolA-like protein 3 n=1 Tax=Nicrophorus vespilloides TaxID=110193 RepID=A0ABM1N7Q8_NICVS|nr:PREDICTED: bolA-like protein 3 [Nicrophorus vespilloides]